MRDNYIDVLENYVSDALEKGSVDFEKQIEEIKEILDLESDI